IATDLEGVRGMVEEGDTGWLIPAGNADRLAAALDQANADRAELRRRSERAREIANTQLGTWAETAQAYDTLFRAALGSNEGGYPSCAG
ncbi:MAG TPA: glycosyltransferase, partial [Rhodanobacteraceae bacterium]|nr:glycosyltransferase [Rhodanobacteraceae bacterium]